MLPQLLGGFRAAHPRVEVTLRVDATGSVIDRVLDRDLELGVVGARRSHRALEFEPFLRDRVVLAVPAGHRFAGRVVSLAELVAEPQVVMQSGAGVRTVIEDELRQAGVRVRDLKVAMEAGLQESAKSAVEAGLRRVLPLVARRREGAAAGDARDGRGGGPRPGARLLLGAPGDPQPPAAHRRVPGLVPRAARGADFG